MDLLASLKSFFKTDTTTINNNIFRLHYKVTGVILIAFSILVTGRQYLGDPIECMSSQEIPHDLLDMFCWVHTTFSLPHSWEKKIGTEVIYPGIGTYKEGDTKVYHAYYQWVSFVLFLQALLFYLPRYFWKVVEGHRIKNLIMSLNAPILTEETKTTNKKLLVNYLKANLNNNNTYFIAYVIAEILNFVNVVGQMYLMDAFLGGEFTKYGTEVLKFSEWEGSLRYDPMLKVFPRLTKCTFHKFGSGGSVELYDATCILPINIINEKIYIFLWFWFIILAVLSSLVLVYRGILIFWPVSRFMILRWRNRLVEAHCLETITKNINLGDWLVIDLLSKNMDPLNFRDLIKDFSIALNEKDLSYVSC